MRQVIVLLIILVISIASTAQEKQQPVPASLAGAPLVTLEKQMLRAERIGDLNFIQNTLAPDFEEITPDGRLLGKADVAEALKTLHLDSLQADNFRVQMLRDEIGIVTYTVQAAGRLGGQPLRVSAYASSTWRRQKDRWQVVFHQNTLLPQPAVAAAELEGLEQDLVAREAARDVEWLKQIFAEIATVVGADGKRYSGAELASAIGQGPNMARKISDLKATPLGPDSGLVTSRLDVQAPDGVAARYQSTSLWKRGPGGWQVLFHQDTLGR